MRNQASLYRPMRLIFLARKGKAETGSILHTEPKRFSETLTNGMRRFVQFRFLLGPCSLKKKIQRLIFGYLFIKEKVGLKKTISAKSFVCQAFQGY